MTKERKALRQIALAVRRFDVLCNERNETDLNLVWELLYFIRDRAEAAVRKAGAK